MRHFDPTMRDRHEQDELKRERLLAAAEREEYLDQMRWSGLINEPSPREQLAGYTERFLTWLDEDYRHTLVLLGMLGWAYVFGAIVAAFLNGR